MRAQLLASDTCVVVDCVLELFIWTGATSRAQDRRLALLLAAQLGRQREAAGGVRVAITRILDSSETILFKVCFPFATVRRRACA